MGGLEMSLPEWFMESSGLSEHEGEEVIVNFLPCEGMTPARKLRFKTLDPLPEWLDVRDVLEEPLSQLGVIKQGQVLPIPVLDSVVLILDSAEPTDDFLFLDGDGIEIDVFMDEETATTAAAAAAPLQQHQEEEQERTTAPIEEPFSFVPTSIPSSGFVPFSGKGHTLGTGKPVWDSNK
jgi:hypothetical protein